VKGRPTPQTIADCEAGSIVRIEAGVIRVAWFNSNGTPCVRLLDPSTLVEVGEPFAIRPELAVVKVLRDQSFYAALRGAGGRETDPLTGR
jgi:hypothetical protein